MSPAIPHTPLAIVSPLLFADYVGSNGLNILGIRHADKFRTSVETPC